MCFRPRDCPVLWVSWHFRCFIEVYVCILGPELALFCVKPVAVQMLVMLVMLVKCVYFRSRVWTTWVCPCYSDMCLYILGPEFALFCVNHLVLPMLQSWLRRSTRLHGYWEGPVANFKQCCGLCTDLVVEFIVMFSGKIWKRQAFIRYSSHYKLHIVRGHSMCERISIWFFQACVRSCILVVCSWLVCQSIN